MRLPCFLGVALLGLLVACAVDEEIFEPRSYDGTGNNEDFPAWGAAGTSQIRAVAGADYADDIFTPPGELRPSSREVMTDVFRASSPSISHMNAVAIAWGQLLLYDLSLTVDNASEPFDIPCDDGGGVIDIWCPQGEASEPISFSRSDASVSGSVRSPTNYATSFIDLDFVYGRSKEQADALRTFEGGFMNVTENGMPFRNADGTWMIADQRSAKFPVTFALHVVLLLEHNRCCTEIAPGLGYDVEEDIFQACRGWTIATFQHVTEDDYLIRLLGSSIGDWTADRNAASSARRLSRAPLSSSSSKQRRELMFEFDDYDPNANPSADVFTIGSVTAAFESALTSTLRIVSEGYVATDYDHLELTVAGGDIAGLFERVEIADVLRGAVLAPVLTVGAHYVAAVSNMSPLFKLPVDAVQRGRDHGVPTYNDVREEYGLPAATSFSDVSLDTNLAKLLFDAYGGDIDSLDACTGALAEDKNSSEGGVLGELLHAAWVDQMYRSFFGDRYHHLHSRPIENVSLVSISALIERTLNVTDLPESGFEVPGVTVCTGDCEAVGAEGFTLGESYAMAWEVDDEFIAISVSAWGIDDSGMLGIGFGGSSMTDAQDYVICEVMSADEAVCTDRAPTGGRSLPELDNQDPDLEVTEVKIDGDWTTVTFLKSLAPLDEQDYDLGQDIDNEDDTAVIYSYKKGAGIGQHPNTNRGDATVNFVTGEVEIGCDDDTNFVSLHGALMLIAWMLIAPVGIYFVRYHKGNAIRWAGREWYEMHAEIMVVASEAVLPLGITAVFASRGMTSVAHANWGYYMIAAVAIQIFTGWLRTKGLEAKQFNFSSLHRFNKHFHIWAGRFAYVAGVVQCYRGLELVSSEDQLLFSAGDGLDLQLLTFGWVKSYLFPVWLTLIVGAFLFFETRKQYRRYFKKGVANVCGVMAIVNEMHDHSLTGKKGRMIPRTMDLPIYSVAAFNDKVLHGQVWVLVDEAILDVSDFAQRHPGGRRLILNATGTDVTQELVGKGMSVGQAMSFPRHVHSGSAWRIIRSLVVGYIEEEDYWETGGVVEVEDEGKGQTRAEVGDPSQDDVHAYKNRRFRVAGQAVMLLNNRQSLGADNMAKKAMRLNNLATIPTRGPAPAMRPRERMSTESSKGSTRRILPPIPKEINIPQRESRQNTHELSSTDLLQRFQVCPFMFREKMGAVSAIGRGHLPSKRPVYRYVFSCPGKAHAQAQAISGVCYFNMRAQGDGMGVVQRAYNAFAVRVQGFEPPMPGGRLKTWRGSHGKGPSKVPKVVPADETTEGILCIEVRIRMYHDGAMSKLLEKLAKDTDNPVVQLQGPFLIEKLAPPPAHHNIVMIAAGTGINPMVQQIRDYMDHFRDSGIPMRSRLALLWQSTCEADFFGTDEITAFQEKSNGLLEVTALVSGGARKRNAPGAAFRKAKDRILSRNVSASPASSSGSSINPFSSAGATPTRSGGKAAIGGNSGGSDAEHTPSRFNQMDQDLPLPSQTPRLINSLSSRESEAEGGGTIEKRAITRGRKAFRRKAWGSIHPVDTWTSGSRCGTGITDISSYQVGDGLVQGKVNREILEKVFGEPLMASLESFNRKRAMDNLLREDSDADDEKHELQEGKDGGEAAGGFIGADEKAGKLQVVVSGPSEFVLHVEQLLTELGVPSASTVLLD